MTAQPHPDELAAVAAGTHGDPHTILGPHPGTDGVVVRTLRPLADAVTIRTLDGEHPAEHVHGGIWSAVLPTGTVPDYRVVARYGDTVTTLDDPYRFLPTVGALDLHLIAEGRHEQLWTVLGANVRSFDSVLGAVRGTSFAVWAPNARAVRVVGDFNHWQGASHAMRALGTSGVWELFVPGVTGGARYKFEILGRDGSWRQKADPLARGTEVPPATGSVVVESSYAWGDEAWLARRASTDPHQGPMSVYEVHLGSWRPGLGYREMADQLAEHGLGVAATVVNRVQPAFPSAADPTELAAAAAPDHAALWRNLAGLQAVAAAERAVLTQLAGDDRPPLVEVPRLATDVHDARALDVLAAAMFGG